MSSVHCWRLRPAREGADFWRRDVSVVQLRSGSAFSDRAVCVASSTPPDTAVFTWLRWMTAQGRMARPLPLAGTADYPKPPGLGGAVFTSIVVGTDGSAPARE